MLKTLPTETDDGFWADLLELLDTRSVIDPFWFVVPNGEENELEFELEFELELRKNCEFAFKFKMNFSVSSM